MKKFWQIFYDALMRFSDDDAWAIASHIALSGLTSLFPFLIFVGAITGMIGAPALAQEASKILFDAWPEVVAGPIANQVNDVLTQPRSGVVTISAVLALYFASSGIEALRVGLNRAYTVKDPRPWWLLRLESIGFVLICALALIAFAFLVVLAPLIWSTIVRVEPKLDQLTSLINLGRFIAIFITLILVLVFVHRFLAAGRRRLRDLMPGVIMTCILWVCFGEGFGLYLARFSSNYITTYAGLASVMIAIVFLYSLSAIFIFGGEMNSAILRDRARRMNALEQACEGKLKDLREKPMRRGSEASYTPENASH